MKKYLTIVFIGVYLVSCIPTKDLTYFQGAPKNETSIHQTQNTPYKLQVNDILDIQIKANDMALVSLFKKKDDATVNTITTEKLYFDSYSVDLNGLIRIPYLDEINVLGYTIKEVREKIENEIGKMFKEKNAVFITVKLAGIRYTVTGEVKNPGSNILYQNQVNIMEAIANAGDIMITGDRKSVMVIRNNVDGIEKFELDLTGFDFVNSNGYFIQPNDIIYIKPLKQKSWGTGDTGAKTFTTIVTALSLITTTILLIKNL